MSAIKSFKLESGHTFNGLTTAAYQEFWNWLEKDIKLSREKYIESSAFSAAMVLRVALGLSASGATITALIDDCRAGSVAAATLRVLSNAGASCSLLSLTSLKAISSNFENELSLADKSGVQLVEIQPDDVTSTLEHVSNCHAVLLGLYQGAQIESKLSKSILSAINDMQTPVHAIEAPPGMNPETGIRLQEPIFAATTITLGIPLSGLSEGYEFCGRIYVCDISVPTSKYAEIAPALIGLFESQPVNQIFSS